MFKKRTFSSHFCLKMFKKYTFSNIFGKKCTIFSNFEFKNAKKNAHF